MSTTGSPLDSLRRPEYTGENRCIPCTVVNAALAVALAAGVAVVWLPAGAFALAVAAAVIYLRGYLVPGTPTLTRRYLPERVLRLFGKEPVDARGEAAVGGRAPEEIEELLVSADVVEECEDVDDLCLTDDFREVWRRRIRKFREDEAVAASQLAAVLEVAPTDLSFDDGGDYFTASYEGDMIGRWDSEAAFYADLAVEPTLSEWLPDWEELGDSRRTELIAGMRALLERCQACEAELEQAENVRRSCCSSDVVGVSVTCEECGATVFRGSYR